MRDPSPTAVAAPGRRRPAAVPSAADGCALALAPRDYAAVAVERVRCACCGGTDHVLAARGDRHGLGLRTVACARCGLLFTSPRPPERWFHEFYRLHYRRLYEAVDEPDAAYLARDWVRGRHERNVERLAPWLGPRGTVADIGCAEGSFLDAFRARFPAWTLRGVEPSERFSAFARTHFGLAGVETGELTAIERWAPGEVDLVTAGHVLEHLLHPDWFFDAVHRLLAPDGLLFVDVPDAEGADRGLGHLHVAHVHHFTAASLRNFCERHGFAVESCERGRERPQWTLQLLARRRAAARQDWAPPPVDARAIARAFRRRCRASWTYRSIDGVRQACRTLAGRR